MKTGMTELEEKTVRRLLGDLYLPLILEVQAKWNNPCAFPPVKIYRTDKRRAIYGFTGGVDPDAFIIYEMSCGDCTKECCIPEAYIKVMDDIENGKILQSDADPNLGIEYRKSYEPYKS